jgi:dolichyl-diphosphooligosaccharide--protein glycosyltransferase
MLTDGISAGSPQTGGRPEPLLILTLALASTLLGGVSQADFVLAVYPVFTAFLSGILVFVLTRTLTGDNRIAVVAVVILAVTPLHASRTALGSADHHAFDYFWLLLTATTLIWLFVKTEATQRDRWLVGSVFGIAISGQTLAWGASPLMLAPVGVAIGVASIVLIETEDPVQPVLAISAGLGLAAVVVQLINHLTAWHSQVVAGVPVGLFIGALTILGLLYVVDRFDRSWPTLLGCELISIFIAAIAVWLVVPELGDVTVGLISEFSAYIERLQGSGIGETKPIIAAFGPVVGPLVLLGFSPFLGLPAVVWGAVRAVRRHEPAWIVLVVYALWFLALAFVQRRFAVQLGLFLSVFAAIGFVFMLAWFGVLVPPQISASNTAKSVQQTLPLPDRRRFIFLAGFGGVGIGSGTVYSRYILSEISIDDAAYEAAAWMREYATEQNWTYPRNYVLAHWGRARMYNYFVNGESRSYSYAREHYESFMFDSDAAAWYDQLNSRVGFVVTRDEINTNSFQIHARLHDAYGSASNVSAGVSHFRAVWESADRSVKVFTLVPGVTVTGTGPPETELTLVTSFDIAGTDRTIQYRRQTTTDEDGAFSLTLAHPGTYEFTDRSQQVIVREADIRDGTELTVQM